MLLVEIANVGKELPHRDFEGGYAFITGLIIVCGATAYRVLKRRILKIGHYDIWERIKEYASLAIVAFILIVGISTSIQIYPQVPRNPIGFFVIPLWSLITYFLIRFRGKAL